MKFLMTDVFANRLNMDERGGKKQHFRETALPKVIQSKWCSTVIFIYIQNNCTYVL